MPLYRYIWGNNKKRQSLKGRTCRIITVGTMNSIRIKFLDNGQEEIVSRRWLRKISIDLADQSQAGINRFRLQRELKCRKQS